MTFLFWLALVIGGGLFLLSLFGDVFGIEKGGEEFYADVDTDGDTQWGRIFSLRNATYFMFAFGAVGVLLDYVWRGQREVLALVIAAVTGLAAWMFSAVVFAYLKRTDSGEMPGDRLLIGKVARVTLPITRAGAGKIEVMKGAQTQELLARPLDDAEAEPESWSSVMVIEVRDGVALVAPYTDDELQ